MKMKAGVLHANEDIRYQEIDMPRIEDNELLVKMASKYNKTVAQLCIQYCLATNTLPLPKSKTKERIIANLDVYFEIEPEDLKYLDSLGHIGPTRPYRS